MDYSVEIGQVDFIQPLLIVGLVGVAGFCIGGWTSCRCGHAPLTTILDSAGMSIHIIFAPPVMSTLCLI